MWKKDSNNNRHSKEYHNFQHKTSRTVLNIDFFFFLSFYIRICLLYMNETERISYSLSIERRQYQFYPLLRLCVYFCGVSLANHAFELDFVHSRRVLLLSSFFHSLETEYMHACLVFHFGTIVVVSGRVNMKLFSVYFSFPS